MAPWTGSVPLQLSSYFVIVVITAAVGLRLVQGQALREDKNRLVAWFDLLWVAIASLGLVAAFANVGARAWPSTEHETQQRFAAALASMGSLDERQLVASNCEAAPSFKLGGAVTKAKFGEQVGLLPCRVALRAAADKRALDKALSTISQACTSAQRQYFDQRLFRREGGASFSACSQPGAGGDACTQAQCEREGATYKLMFHVMDPPLAFRDDAFLREAREPLSQGAAVSRSGEAEGWKPAHPAMFLFTLALFSAALGLRLAKAVYDLCVRIEETPLPLGATSRLFLQSWTRLRLHGPPKPREETVAVEAEPAAMFSGSGVRD